MSLVGVPSESINEPIVIRRIESKLERWGTAFPGFRNAVPIFTQGERVVHNRPHVIHRPRSLCLGRIKMSHAATSPATPQRIQTISGAIP